MDDLISRQAAIDALKNRWKKTRYYEGIGDDIAEECELCLKQVPTAEERKAGTWKEFHGNKNMCICQSCGFMVNKSLLYDYTEKDPLVLSIARLAAKKWRNKE